MTKPRPSKNGSSKPRGTIKSARPVLSNRPSKKTRVAATPSKKRGQGKHENIGRPTKYTEIVVGKLEREFRNNRKVITACRRAGISKDTFYEWLKLYPDFSDRMEAAQETPIADAEDSMMKKIRKGDGQLALRFLERADPKRYRVVVETKDITPPSAKRIIVGTLEPHPMIRPDAADKTATDKAKK